MVNQFKTIHSFQNQNLTSPITFMKKLAFILFLSSSISTIAQHDHHVDDSKTGSSGHNHLAHMLASRAQNFYIHSLPAPKLMKS